MQRANITTAISIGLDTERITLPGKITAEISNSGSEAVQVTLRLFQIGRTITHQVATALPAIVAPGTYQSSSIELSKHSVEGPYALAATVELPGSSVNLSASLAATYIPLWAGPEAPADVAAAVHSALLDQERRMNQPIFAPGFTGATKFTVHVLLEGCIVDDAQPIESGFLSPLPFGLSCESEIAALNKLLESDVFHMEAALNDRWQAAHPLSLVTYSNVFAQDEEQAYNAVANRIGLLGGVLAMVRSAPSRPIAVLVRANNGHVRFIMPISNYRGNLLPGLVAGQVSRELDDFVDAAMSDPWIDLIIRMYNSAVGESDALFRVFRLWSVLESCAKRRDLPGFDACLVNPKKALYEIGGEQVFGKDLARVSYYVQEVIPLKDWRVDNAISNCEFLRRVYVVRNIAAHEGVVNRATLTQDRIDAVDYASEPTRLLTLQELTQFALSTEKRCTLTSA